MSVYPHIIRPGTYPPEQITFSWQRGKQIIETVFREGKLQFAVADKGRKERIKYCNSLAPYTPVPWLTPYVTAHELRLPSEVGQVLSLDELAEMMQTFIYKYFDCDPNFLSTAVLYAQATWVYERFHAVPYLRFLGLAGSGKTRGTETIGACCYHPLVLAGSISPAPMYRMIEVVGGTMLIDEADFARSNIGNDIIKVLNCGYQKGMAVTRMEKGESGEFEPRRYEVFGPKVINGRRPFQDDATENRCLQHTPRVTNRLDIPTQLTDTFHQEANAIQNAALGWRMRNLDTFKFTETHIPGVRNRTNQIITPLLSIASKMLEPAATRYREEVIAYVRQLEADAMSDRQDTAEAKLVRVYVTATEEGVLQPTCTYLANRFHVTGTTSDYKWLTAKVAGKVYRNMGFTTHHANKGSVVSVDESRLQALCQRFGIVSENVTTDEETGD